MGAKSQVFSFSPPESMVSNQSSHESNSNNQSPVELESDLSNYYNIREIHNEPLAATSVLLAYRKCTGEKVAVKKIHKEGLINDFLKTQAKQECALHASLSHPNIVKVFEWLETEKDFKIIMEFVENPTLLKEKIDTNLLPIEDERRIKLYIQNILEALVYIHSKGIIHGDLKLENILLKTNEDQKNHIFPYIAKICDFGLAKIVDPDTKKFFMEFCVGSTNYMAPEMKNKSYVDEKIDLWALGIIMYKMIVAYKPTQMPGYKSYTQPVPFRQVDWQDRSPELQDLVAQLLILEPEKRISAKEALNHPWFQNKSLESE